MSVPVDVDELEPTRSERWLAVVLVLFLLIGGGWAYYRLDRGPAELTQTEQAAVEAHQQAGVTVTVAERRRGTALEQLEVAREAYRTALDAGTSVGQLRPAYERAQRRFREAEAGLRAARAAREALDARSESAVDRVEERRRRLEIETFALRFFLVLGYTAASAFAFRILRRRRPRYSVLALAGLVSAAILTVVTAGDYSRDYLGWTEWGPLPLSLFGIALTVGSFIGVQRSIGRRLPRRRVHRRECPFCGERVRDNVFCEGCGRAVVADCATCGQPRRVGTAHCGACGAG